jgi:hypothetical protein
MGYFNGKNEFYWGVASHDYKWRAYPAEKLEEQIKAAAEMNLNLYRVDIHPDSEEFGFDYLDKTVGLCEKYQLDMMFIIYNSNEAAFKTAKRYKGRVKYYQISNERDCQTCKIGDGLKIEEYDMVKLAETVKLLNSIIKEIREGDPDAKLIINATWWHTGFIDYLIKEKVDFDIIGWDWYSNMDKAWYDGGTKQSSVIAVMDKQCTYGKEILFCEINVWNQKNGDVQERRSAYLLETMTKIYNYPSDLIKGYVIYELLDEPTHSNESERIFGMLECDEAGIIGKPKDAYFTVQYLLK